MHEGYAEPVDAATVILVREGDPWQCFMVRRHAQSDFAADVFVFPGGKVDAPDLDPDTHRHVKTRKSEAPPDLPMRIAALRELFEEAGVLLARSMDGSMVRLEGKRRERFATYRRELHAGKLTLSEIARDENIVFDVDELAPFSRWITPETLPRRFDTRFFVARMPDGQDPMHDAVETIDSLWIAPALALHRFRQGRFPLVFATEKHLERMSRFDSIEVMIESISAGDLQPVLPRMQREGDRVRFLLREDEAYGAQTSSVE